jgi:hypothetical protein
VTDAAVRRAAAYGPARRRNAMIKRLTLGMVLMLLASSAMAQMVQKAPRRAARAQVPLTLQLLNQRIPEVRYDQADLEAVLNQLADLAQVQIQPRWDKLEGADVRRDTPITFTAKDLTFQQVMWLVMKAAAGSSDLTLAYRMSGNLLILSTEEDLGKDVITRVYDVADLLLQVANQPLPTNETSTGLGQTSTSGGGSSIFGNSQTQIQQQTQQTNPGEATPEMKALIELIQETIDPDTWADGRGGPGAPGHIRAWRSQLIITNTILVHQKIAGYVKAVGAE